MKKYKKCHLEAAYKAGFVVGYSWGEDDMNAQYKGHIIKKPDIDKDSIKNFMDWFEDIGFE